MEKEWISFGHKFAAVRIAGVSLMILSCLHTVEKNQMFAVRYGTSAETSRFACCSAWVTVTRTTPTPSARPSSSSSSTASGR